MADLGTGTTKSGLNLGLLCLPEESNVISSAVVGSADLVERIVGVLLKLFPDLVDLLVPPQSLLTLHLFQSSILKSLVCSLESSLGMLVNLVLSIGRQGQGIQSIVDTSGIERPRRSRWLVKLGQIESLGFLLCRLCISSLLSRQRCFLFCCEGGLLGLFTSCLFGLLLCCLTRAIMRV